MADRVLSVNAYTTLDLVEGEAEGHGWHEETYAVVNVTTPETPEAVTLELELDNSQLDHLPAHADRVRLSPAEARKLAGELERYADRVEDAGDEA